MTAYGKDCGSEAGPVSYTGLRSDQQLAKKISIIGARIHNLKNIDVEIPKNKLTVITGVSGSGKSSLAFDTLYEEGKRRYLMFSDTQFMVDNVPSFDRMTGLSPTVAVEQRITRQSNPRSTVGTRTKIGSMLAALFAAYGKRSPEHENGHPLSMEMFQKNSPKGMCVRCLGKGTYKKLDEDRIFEGGSQKIYRVFGLDLGLRGKTRKMLDAFCLHHGLSIDTRISELAADQLHILKYGDGRKTFVGYLPWINDICNGAFSTSGRLAYLLNKGGYIQAEVCPKCGGSGLNEQAAHTKINGYTITQLEGMPVSDLCALLKQDRLSCTKLLEETIVKLECLIDIGLHYIALSRPVPTLSGGEIQRLFLASYIIAEMDSIIFILDEPTIGMHEAEKRKLLDIITGLIARGNTVVSVEHDINFIRAADYIVDLGPGAGEYGGESVFQGTYGEYLKCGRSATAPYLSGARSMPVKAAYKPPDRQKTLRLANCNIHNLRNVSVGIPLGLLVGVAGVSGSGKSSLVTDTLVPRLHEALGGARRGGGAGGLDSSEDDGDGAGGLDGGKDDDDSVGGVHREGNDGGACGGGIDGGVTIYGVHNVNRVVVIDQKPIGRTRTSCPATYTGIFDRVRKLFAESVEAASQGFRPEMFSANSKGKCRACGGDGVLHYHIGFGNFIDVDCETCGTSGFTPESMSIAVSGKTIRDILNMDVESAIGYFQGRDQPICRMLKTLERVGLGYMRLGQKTPTISGGEAQRIKLAKELGRARAGSGNVYVLDEPTTGLSLPDSERLISLMQELVGNGNTVIVTEHDPTVLSNCDHIIEMGPGGGSDGGLIIAEGTPSELKNDSRSMIGRYLFV